VKCVRNWLRGERPDNRLPGAKRMWSRFESFKGDLPLICEGLLLEPDALEFNDLTTVVEQWLRLNPG